MLSIANPAWGQVPFPEAGVPANERTNERSTGYSTGHAPSNNSMRISRQHPFLSNIQLPQDLPVLVKQYDLEKQSFAGSPPVKTSKNTVWQGNHRPAAKAWPPWIKQIPYQEEPLYLRNEYSGFWRKAARAELLIGGVEVFGMVVLMSLPKEVTHWEEDWMKAAGRNLKRAFTSPPVMDKDDWVINYIGHPVAGSYYYNAVRSQNANWWQSLLFSTFQSFLWEYVIEGVAEQPSIQDLIVTPLAGFALGEPTHLATLAMRRNGFNFLEKVVVFIINPMYVLNNGYKNPYSQPGRRM